MTSTCLVSNRSTSSRRVAAFKGCARAHRLAKENTSRRNIGTMNHSRPCLATRVTIASRSGHRVTAAMSSAEWRRRQPDRSGAARWKIRNRPNPAQVATEPSRDRPRRDRIELTLRRTVESRGPGTAFPRSQGDHAGLPRTQSAGELLRRTVRETIADDAGPRRPAQDDFSCALSACSRRSRCESVSFKTLPTT